MTKKDELIGMLQRINSYEEMEKVQAKYDEVNAEIQGYRDKINELLIRIDDVGKLESIVEYVKGMTV